MSNGNDKDEKDKETFSKIENIVEKQETVKPWPDPPPPPVETDSEEQNSQSDSDD